ncbi:MAG: hypothetical protein RML72_03730 [Bacteroidia bacterium]|nr:hypothetical protein [Bacteroidia bacterium]MDW8157972.1 hypothetical protein [Bacteroidia bacterium]
MFYQTLVAFLVQIVSKGGASIIQKQDLINNFLEDYHIFSLIAQHIQIPQGNFSLTLLEDNTLENTLHQISLLPFEEQNYILITALVFIYSFLGFTPQVEEILHLFLVKTGFSTAKYLSYRQKLQEDSSICSSSHGNILLLLRQLAPELQNLVTSLHLLKELKKC